MNSTNTGSNDRQNWIKRFQQINQVDLFSIDRINFPKIEPGQISSQSEEEEESQQSSMEIKYQEQYQEYNQREQYRKQNSFSCQKYQQSEDDQFYYTQPIIQTGRFIRQHQQHTQINNYNDSYHQNNNKEYIDQFNDSINGNGNSKVNRSNKHNKSSIPRQKKSIVWKFFKLVHSSEHIGPTHTGEVAVCIICGKQFRRRSNYSTSDMLRHLKNSHHIPMENQIQNNQQIQSYLYNNDKQLQTKRVRGSISKVKKQSESPEQSNIQYQDTLSANKNTNKKIDYESSYLKKQNKIFDLIENKMKKQQFRPRTCPSWEVFILDKQNKKVICQLCNFIMKRRNNRSNEPMHKHLEKNHPEVKWLLDKQVKEGLFQMRDEIHSMIRQKNKSSEIKQKKKKPYIA